jgi:hypothetical protein
LQYLSKLVKALRSGPVQKINFTLLGIHVSGHDFETIAQQMELGHIPIRRDPSIPPGFTMRYNPPNKALLFRVAPIDFFTSLEAPRTVQHLVHEAVHAALHYRKDSLLYENNEAAAFVAGTMYGLTAGLTPSTSANLMQSGLKVFLSKHSAPFTPPQSNKLLTVYSYLVAQASHSGKQPNAADVKGLLQAICGIPGYAQHCGAKLNFGSPALKF